MKKLILTILLYCPSAYAEPPKERPYLLQANTSITENANTLWHNSANMGFKSGSSSRFLINSFQSTESQGITNSELSYTSTSGPLGFGLRYQKYDGNGWWSTASGLSIPINKSMRIGTNLSWQVPSGGQENFFGWDLGYAWRPFKWLGFAGALHNIGASNEEDAGNNVEEYSLLGMGLRFFNGRLQMGVDFKIDEENNTQAFGLVQSKLTKALDIFVRYDEDNSFGGGINLNLDQASFGGGAVNTAADALHIGLSYGKDSNQGDNYDRKNVIPFFHIKTSYPYQSVGGLFGNQTEEYTSLLQRLRVASNDKVIKGVLFQFDSTPFSFAKAQEIRTEIENMQKAGKTVTVYLGRSASNISYYIASKADRIYLHPSLDLSLTGLVSERIYMRGLLNWIGVEPEFIKRSDFKSAPEQFTNHEGSESARQQNKELLDDFYDQLCQGIAEGRALTVDKVKEFIDIGPLTSEQARELNLIDGVKYPDEMKDLAKELHGPKSTLLKKYGGNQEYSGWGSTNKIAIIYITGTIMTGRSTAPGLFGGATTTGSQTIIDQLTKVAESNSIKAVVLRVDSPGGSAFASDEIWRAVEKVKEEGKPVIVSMGGVAASGGYFVSAGADAIYAEPTTITGSIGVYAGKFNLQKMMEKLNINIETETRGRNAAMYSSFKSWDEVERNKLESLIENTYVKFKKRVADGRNLTDEQVEEVARGRVWSGKAAKDNGLVDELGGMFDAVYRAREEAGVPVTQKLDIVTFDNKGTSLPVVGQLLQGERFNIDPSYTSLNSLLNQYQSLSNEYIWMLMPYQIRIK